MKVWMCCFTGGHQVIKVLIGPLAGCSSGSVLPIPLSCFIHHNRQDTRVYRVIAFPNEIRLLKRKPMSYEKSFPILVSLHLPFISPHNHPITYINGERDKVRGNEYKVQVPHRIQTCTLQNNTPGLDACAWCSQKRTQL